MFENLGQFEQIPLELIIIFGALLLVAIIFIIFLILSVIGKWKMFKKAGEAGWKALIPIYEIYTQCVLVGVSPWWLLIILICYLIASFFIPFKFVAAIVLVYFLVIVSLSTARSYGKTDTFGFGIFLLSPVFNMILGFDSGNYEGKKPVGDLLGRIINKQEKNEKKNVKEDKKASAVKTTNTKNKATTKQTPSKKKTSPKTKKTTTKGKTVKPKSTSKSSKKSTTDKKTTTKKTTPKKSTTKKSRTTKK